MREIRMLRTMWRELETELRDGLRHRHAAKAAGKQLLPRPTATAPALDPTTSVAERSLFPFFNVFEVFGHPLTQPCLNGWGQAQNQVNKT